MEQLKKKFSDLIELSSCDFRDDVLFLIEDYKENKTYNISFEQLKKQLLSDIKQKNIRKIFGTMVFEDKWDYAKVFHDHDIYTSAMLIQDDIVGEGELSELFEMKDITNPNEAKTYTLSVRYEDVSKYKNDYEPLIGEIKFAKSVNGIVEENVDGWVTPKGQSYDLNDFSDDDQKKLKIVFKNDGSRITLPNINDFFKSDTDILINKSDLSRYPYQIGLPKHKHDMQNDSIDIKSEYKFNDGNGQDFISPKLNDGGNDGKALFNDETKVPKEIRELWNGKKPAIHGSRNNPSILSLVIESNMNTKMAFDLDQTGSDEEPYPKHHRIPILIYIGQPKK